MAIWDGNILNDFENCRDRSRTALVLFACAVSCLWCGFAQSCDWDSRYAVQHYGFCGHVFQISSLSSFAHCFMWTAYSKPSLYLPLELFCLLTNFHGVRRKRKTLL